MLKFNYGTQDIDHGVFYTPPALTRNKKRDVSYALFLDSRGSEIIVEKCYDLTTGETKFTGYEAVFGEDFEPWYTKPRTGKLIGPVEIE